MRASSGVQVVWSEHMRSSLKAVCPPSTFGCSPIGPILTDAVSAALTLRRCPEARTQSLRLHPYGKTHPEAGNQYMNERPGEKVHTILSLERGLRLSIAYPARASLCFKRCRHGRHRLRRLVETSSVEVNTHCFSFTLSLSLCFFFSHNFSTATVANTPIIVVVVSVQQLFASGDQNLSMNTKVSGLLSLV